MNIFSLTELFEWAMASFVAWIVFGVTAASGVAVAGFIADMMFVAGSCFLVVAGKELAYELIRQMKSFLRA